MYNQYIYIYKKSNKRRTIIRTIIIQGKEKEKDLDFRFFTIYDEMIEIRRREKERKEEKKKERKERRWSSSGLIILNGVGGFIKSAAFNLTRYYTCSPQPKRPIKIPNFAVIGPIVRSG